MSKENIQRHECQVIRKVYDEAGDARKVMTVGVDLAKQTHKAVISNGFGDILCKAFNVRNDVAGREYMEGRIRALCHKHGISEDHVIIGVETPGRWAYNFADSLVAEGWLVIDLHPYEAKKQRENETTDNDRLSAQTICHCLHQRKGSQRVPDSVYNELQLICRHRNRLIKQKTSLSNKMIGCWDVLLPGIIEKSGLTVFGEASLDVAASLTLKRLKRMSVEQLAQRLRRHHATDCVRKAQTLKQLAGGTLGPDPVKERAMQFEIQHLIAQYRLVVEQAGECEQRLAILLRQTPHALLTTIDGIGVVTAAQAAGELYARQPEAGVESKVNYSGLVNRTHQTGGDDKPAKKKGKPRRINTHAKRTMLMIAENVALNDKSDLQRYFARKEGENKNAKYYLARKLIRFCEKLRQCPQPYVPQWIREDPDAETALRRYLETVAYKLQGKWQSFSKSKPDYEKDVLSQWIDLMLKCSKMHDLTVS
jgi:hypothetical protein